MKNDALNFLKSVVHNKDIFEFITSYFSAGKYHEKEALRGLYQQFDMIVQDIDRRLKIKHPDKPELDCKKGCFYCCHLNVDAIPVEAEVIWEYIKQNYDEKQIEIFKAELVSKHSQTEKMEQTERTKLRIKCPFLMDDKTCGVYPVRPFACRGWSSYNVRQCEIGFNDISEHVESPVDGNRKFISEDCLNGMAYVYITDDQQDRAFGGSLEEQVLKVIENQK